MRIVTAAAVLVCLMASLVQAGLQNVLQNRSIGIQITPILPLRLPAPPIPEGALFIDPFESTRGEGVFRGGPEFEYDATTGSLSVFAPPMLGPADEFGIRQQYSPQSIKLFGREFFSDSPSIPKISRYRRNKFEYSRFNSQPVPFDEGDPSFVMDENSDSFGLYISPENIQVNASWGRELSAAEVDFSSLLMPGLNAEVFAAEEGPILPNSIWPYLPNIKESLPDVYFVVDYTVSNYFVRNLGSSGSYSLLAVPQAGLFQNSQTTTPEPGTIVLACFAALALLSIRRA